MLIIKGGLLGDEFLSSERVSALADLPSRDALLAMIAGTFGAPMSQLAGLLAALPRNAANAFLQLLEKKEESHESAVASLESEEPLDESTEETQDAGEDPETDDSGLETDAAGDSTGEAEDTTEDE